MTTVPVCSNPFNKAKHIKINGLRKPSKKVLRNYPHLSAEQLLCNGCRKDLSSNKVQYDVYLQQPSTSTVTLEDINPLPVDRKVSADGRQPNFNLFRQAVALPSVNLKIRA